MALTLLNKAIAIKNVVINDHYTKGIVGPKDAAVTLCAQGDTVYFPKGTGIILTYGGQEYIIIKESDLLGKGV